MFKSRNILYRPSWQKLRVSFLKTNHPNGGFSTPEGTSDNLKRLSNYIMDAEGTDLAAAPAYVREEVVRMRMELQEEYACRVARAINLLNATHMGYRGTGFGSTEMDNAVVNYRNSLQEVYNGHLAQRADNNWDWDVIQFELEAMWRNERFWFTAIYSDLDKRRKTAFKRRPDAAQTRPELHKFLDMMEGINRW